MKTLYKFINSFLNNFENILAKVETKVESLQGLTFTGVDKDLIQIDNVHHKSL